MNSTEPNYGGQIKDHRQRVYIPLLDTSVPIDDHGVKDLSILTDEERFRVEVSEL